MIQLKWVNATLRVDGAVKLVFLNDTLSINPILQNNAC